MTTIAQTARKAARSGVLALTIGAMGATSALAGPIASPNGAPVWFGGDSGAAEATVLRVVGPDERETRRNTRDERRAQRRQRERALDRLDRNDRAERRADRRRDVRRAERRADRRRDVRRAERRAERRRDVRRAERRAERRRDVRRAERRAERRFDRRLDRRAERRRLERRLDRRYDRRGYYRDYYRDYDYYDYKDKDDNNRDIAIGVLGAVVGLGLGAAIANSGDGYSGGGYQSAPAPSGGACDYWANQCAGNWGVNNDNFYGCLRYHGCQ